MSAARATVLLALLAGACATSEVGWERVEEPRFVAEDGSYSLELPVGWIRAEQALTRDGWKQQTITFNAGPVLEAEGADAIDPGPKLLAAMREMLASQPGLEVRECRTDTFGGLPGFRLRFTSAPATSEAGQAAREHLLCGAIDGATLYAFSYEAPTGEAFASDLATFERMVASFTPLARPAPSPGSRGE
jgi:hypothetical protein